jgi:hypothetical protein
VGGVGGVGSNPILNVNPQSKIRNPKSKIQNPKSKIQNPKSKKVSLS